MQGNMLSVDVCVHGTPVREYQHNGQLWIEGRKNSDFSIRVKNLTGRRILVVGSVDGLSIMDGKEADYDKGGYILRPFERFDIPGWRLSNDEVAKFFFNKSGKAYAAQMGKPRNIGVIGFAMFHEKYQPPIIRSHFCSGAAPRGGDEHQYSTDATSLSFDSEPCKGDWRGFDQQREDHQPLSALNANTETMRSGGPGAQSRQRVVKQQLAKQELGTGFGERHRHQVESVPFERSSDTPDEVLDIRYDSRQGLRKRGVDLDQRPRVTSEPNAFPGNKGCQPPSGWDG